MSATKTLAVETLVKHLTDTIGRLRKDGIVGMSKDNLRQVCPTKGLTCSVPMYYAAFDEAIEIVRKKYHRFVIED